MSDVQTSVAPAEGVLRRSLQMKQFLSAKKRARFIADIANAKADGKELPQPIVLGQVVGMIFAVEEREGQLPDGSLKKSLFGVGDFEAVNYESGEVFQSNGAYFPGYFLNTAKAMIEKGMPSVEFALEILMEATGKEVPTAYVVRPLLARSADNPLNRIKQALMEAGRLKGLPPPVQPVAERKALPGEIREVGGEPAADESDVIEPDDSDESAPPPAGGSDDGERRPKGRRTI